MFIFYNVKQVMRNVRSDPLIQTRRNLYSMVPHRDVTGLLRMNEVQFWLHISPQTYLSYYRGHTSAVRARTVDGRTVQFPASVLRPFLTRDGINGLFRLNYDARGRLVEMFRIR